MSRTPAPKPEIEWVRKKTFSLEIPDGKKEICLFYRGGRCIFTSAECKFAHGVSDLDFDLTVPEKPTTTTTVVTQKDGGEPAGEMEEMNGGGHDGTMLDGPMKEQIRRQLLNHEQRHLDEPHLGMYEFQFRLLKDGTHPNGQTPYTLEEIDRSKEKRLALRYFLHKELAREYFDRLTASCPHPIAKNFLERHFKKISFPDFRMSMLTEDFYAYEAKLPVPPNLTVKQDVVLKMLPMAELHRRVKERFVEIIVKKAQKVEESKEAVMVYPKELVKEYYSLASDTEPSLHLITRMTPEMKSSEAYVIALQQDPEFMNLLQQRANLPIERIEFVDYLGTKLLTHIKEFLAKSVKARGEKNPHSRVLCFDVERWVEKTKAYIKSRDDAKMANGTNNLHGISVRKICRHVISTEGYLHLQTGNFDVALVNNPKFNPKAMQPSKTTWKCKMYENHIHQEEQKEEEMKLQMATTAPNEKFVMVSSVSEAEEAFRELSQARLYGIDLEGDLRREDGLLELIQISNGKRVFVFDIFKGEVEEATGNPALKATFKAGLQKLLNKPDATCIFHGGTGDNLAIHTHFQACPKVFDTAVVMLFNQVLRSKLNTEPIAEADLHLPALNHVLKVYQASHGQNEYKDEMKKKFGTPEGNEYFLQRPICPRWFQYAARDAEDLIEIYHTMAKESSELLTKSLKIDLTPDDVAPILVKLCTNVDSYCLYKSKRKGS